MRYKSYRVIDGKARWIITNSNGDIINRNPNKEELKALKQIEKKSYKSPMKGLTNDELLNFLRYFYRQNGEVPVRRDFIGNPEYPSCGSYQSRFGSWNKALELAGLDNIYNDTNTCDRCGKDLRLGPGNPRREYNIDGSCTEKWFCGECGTNDFMKKLADSRTGNLDPNCNTARGGRIEEVTCRVHNVKNLNKENDNYRSPIDHSKSPILGVLQTKGAGYDIYRRSWHNRLNNEHNKEFDYLVFYCMSQDWKYIERIYIIPYELVMIRKAIEIVKNPSRKTWYEEYRVDEKPYNDIYQG